MDQNQPNMVRDEEMGSDKPLKQALPKPPGLSNPPSSTTTPVPRRQPRPMPPPKKRRCSFCRGFCCCVCIIFVVILLLLIIALAVFFIWYNPKLPVVRLASFKIANFNFSDGNANAGWSYLTADSTAMLDFRNPNGKLGFYYGDTDVAVIIGEKDFETHLGSTNVKGFNEKPGDRTSLIVPTKVRNRQVDNPTMKTLQGEVKRNSLLVKVIAKAKVGLAVGSHRIVTVSVKIKCGGVRLQTIDTQMAKCTIKMLKWITLRS